MLPPDLSQFEEDLTREFGEENWQDPLGDKYAPKYVYFIYDPSYLGDDDQYPASPEFFNSVKELTAQWDLTSSNGMIWRFNSGINPHRHSTMMVVVQPAEDNEKDRETLRSPSPSGPRIEKGKERIQRIPEFNLSASRIKRLAAVLVN